MNFLFVFNQTDCDSLLAQGVQLINYDAYNNVWTFEVPGEGVEIPEMHVFGNTAVFSGND